MIVRRVADVPLYYNAVDILEGNLNERADKEALLSPDRTMTFRQVSDEVNQVGNALTKLGVRPGDLVALASLDCAEWATSFFAIVKVGAVAVSINTALTSGECDYIFRDCQPRVLIVHEALQETIQEIRDGLPFLEHVVVIGRQSRTGDLRYADWIGGEPTEFQAAHTHRDDICMLNYSSGTTGEPKGIPHAQKDLPLSAQLYAVDAIGMKESDRTCSVAKLFFTYAAGGNLIYAWHAGASIIVSPVSFRVAASFLETIDRFKPTILHGVPTSYASMMAVDGFVQKYDLSSLRMCVSAGEALPAAIWHEWKKATGLEIVEGIGTTENLALFLTNRLGDIRPGSSGRPVEGFEIKIADDEGRPVPVGETGNLFIKGETAALSYLHQYEKSHRTFRGEWLATGDQYYADPDGFHWYVGRVDEMLKVGGIWVSPVEIEHTLAHHEAVQESAVIGHPDRSNLIKPKAFVVLKPGYVASDQLASELIDYCAKEMASYKRPRSVQFVDELPRTATGKLQRLKLRP